VNFVSRPVNAPLGENERVRPSGAMFCAPSISKREKFRTRSSRANGMNAMSSPLRATNATGVFALRFSQQKGKRTTVCARLASPDRHAVLPNFHQAPLIVGHF
jgi:hypothetical protein